MKYSVILIAILLLIFAFIYFSRKKYVELKEEKEDFRNVVVYRYDDINI